MSHNWGKLQFQNGESSERIKNILQEESICILNNKFIQLHYKVALDDKR